MKDRQVKRLYDWEAEWASWNTATVTLPECRKYVRQACEAYNVPPPSVSQHKHNGMSYYEPNEHRISLRHDHKNVPIALHEAAHAIVWTIYGETVEDHGREFCGVYLFLLTAVQAAPEVAITASARAAGIKWCKKQVPSNIAL
jgi:hypothetical protein